MRTPALLLTVSLLSALPGTTLDSQAPSSNSDYSTPVSVRWNRLVPAFMSEATANRRAARAAAAGDSAALRRIAQNPLPMTFNIYTTLSAAQYAAARSPADSRSNADAAIASASAGVLTALFADSAVRSSIARELRRDLERAGSPANKGKKSGDEIARRVIAEAPTISMIAPSAPKIPTGPGMWYSAPRVPLIGLGLVTSRTWLLDSASQFRPAPPPAYGSAEWSSSMEEVRRIARDRTKDQTKLAQQWNSGDPWAVWNDSASAMLRRQKTTEKEATRVLVLLNVAAADAAIACFEAKYHYWTIRPSQVDTTLALADSVPLPNFPSYPSGHACSAGAFDAILGHFFPHEKAKVTRMAEEQAMSRLYAGVHYRFDNDMGLELGRKVARYAIAKENRAGLDRFK